MFPGYTRKKLEIQKHEVFQIYAAELVQNLVLILYQENSTLPKYTEWLKMK